MGLFSRKKKVVKEIDGPVWGHLVNVHKIDVDTLANLMRCVEGEGTLEGNNPVTLLRISRMNHARQKGVTIEGWETLDEHPDLILFEGHVTRNNEVHLEPRKG